MIQNSDLDFQLFASEVPMYLFEMYLGDVGIVNQLYKNEKRGKYDYVKDFNALDCGN